ncbi:H-SHIPPO [Hexamita inflata]|uniref:H-SHIPPO n=1 Tax=Hexamita inflata TaxID=28002 RepID=A0ABP1LP66_9EUKA
MIAVKDILNQHLHNQLKLPSVVSKNILKGARLEPKPNIQRTQSPGPIYYPESKSNYMSRSKYVYIKNKTVELKRAESPSPIDYSPKRDVSSPLLNIHERIQNIYEKKPQTSTKVRKDHNHINIILINQLVTNHHQEFHSPRASCQQKRQKNPLMFRQLTMIHRKHSRI